MHKSILLPLIGLLCSFVFPARAQNNYTEAIQQGDAAFKKGQYKTAINKYFAAEAFDPSKKEVVKGKVNGVFDKIETLRGEADDAKKKAQAALDKANKLVNAFYFYGGRFALAYGEKGYRNVFYFIDRNGNEVRKLGRWDKAEQFERTGFAKVKKNEGGKSKDYLMDTLGQAYSAAFDLNQLDETITALDLSGKGLAVLPEVAFKYEQLKVLVLNYNLLEILPDKIFELKNLTVLNLSYTQLSNLPEKIAELKNLTILDLSLNLLTTLPEKITELKNLTTLDLSNNPIPEAEQEKIRQLLPNCQIKFSILH